MGREMRRLNLRIGTKLGISAAIGIALVAGMMVNDRLSKESISRSDTEANAQHALTLDAIAAKSAVQGAQLAIAQARFGRSLREVDRAMAMLDANAKAGHARIESALNRVTEQESRDRLTKVQSRFNDSLKAAGEIAAKQKELLKLETKRTEATDTWTKTFEALLPKAGSPEAIFHREYDAALKAADSVFKNARLAAVQFQLVGDETLMVAILRAGDEATAFLKAAQQHAPDAALKEKVGELATLVDGFRKILE